MIGARERSERWRPGGSWAEQRSKPLLRVRETIDSELNRHSNRRSSPSSATTFSIATGLYVKDAAERKERLDQILVPMFEHSPRAKNQDTGQILILLDWLVQDEFLFPIFHGESR